MQRKWLVLTFMVLGLVLVVSFVALAQLPAEIPREETLIVDQLTGGWERQATLTSGQVGAGKIEAYSSCF